MQHMQSERDEQWTRNGREDIEQGTKEISNL